MAARLKTLTGVAATAVVLATGIGATAATTTPPSASSGLPQLHAVVQAQVTVTDLADSWARHQREIAEHGRPTGHRHGHR